MFKNAKNGGSVAQRTIVYKVLGVVAGLVFLGFGIAERSSINRVKATGVETVVEPIEGYTVRKSRGSTTYSAQFSFKPESGRQVSKMKSFPEELLPDFKSGGPVKIFYDPRDPGEFVFEKEKPSWFLVLVGAGIVVAALIFG